MSTFTFKVLKSNWGVLIKLTAQAAPLNDEPAVCVAIDKHVYLSVRQLDLKLSDNELFFLREGLARVAHEIPKAVKWRGPTLIELQQLEFNYCDFQEDGLECAIVFWAAQEFQFEPPYLTTNFDKRTNRYRFLWKTDL